MEHHHNEGAPVAPALTPDPTIVNAVRGVIMSAVSQAEMAAEDLGDDLDCALDHPRIARETLQRAERAVHGMVELERAHEAQIDARERGLDQILDERERTGL
jgi:hypothetical protein